MPCKPDIMYQRIIAILFFLCACCIQSSTAYGQKVNYQQFDNIYLGAEASVVSCFLQDSEGLIWIGSNKGLFSYDGYSTQQHFTYGEINNTRIYCGVIIDNTYLYMGTDNGILIYNYRTDRYEQPATDFPTDVRTMALQGDTLWIGALNGLYTYQLQNRKLSPLGTKRNGLPAPETIRFMWEPTTGCAAILPQTGNSKRFPFPSIAVKATCSSIPCWKIRAANVFGSVRKVTFSSIFHQPDR